MNATRKRLFRWLRGVLIVGALAAIAVLAAVAFMQTPPGKRVLASAAGGFLSRMTGQVWHLEGLGGTVPFDLSLERIRWSDHDGPILSIDSVHVGLSVGGLLRGKIHATDVSAERVALQRLPKSAKRPSEKLTTLARLPETLRSVRLDHLAIARLDLAETALGAAAAFSVEGAWRTPSETGGLVSTLRVAGLGDTQARAALRIEDSGQEPDVLFSLNAEDAAFLPKLLPWPDAERVSITIDTGEGSSGSANVLLLLNESALVKGELRLTGGETPGLHWDGNVLLDHPVLPPAYADAGGKHPEVAIELDWPAPGQVEIRAVNVSSEAGRAEISGAYGVDESDIAVQGRYVYEDLGRVMDVPEGMHAGPWEAGLSAKGTLDGVDGTLEVRTGAQAVVEGEWFASLSPAFTFRTSLRLDPQPGVVPFDLERLGAVTASLGVAQDAEGVLHFRSNKVSAAAGSVEFEGNAEFPKHAAEGVATIRIDDAGMLAPLTSANVKGGFRTTVGFSAAKELLRATVVLQSSELHVEPRLQLGNTLIHVDLTGPSWWSELPGAYEIASNGNARVQVDEFFDDEVTYALETTLSPFSELRVDALTVTDENARVGARGTLDLKAGTAKADIELMVTELAGLAPVSERGVGGALALTADVTASREIQSAVVTVDLANLSGLPAAVHEALGKSLRGTTAIEKTGDEVAWRRTNVQAGPLSLQGEGTYRLKDAELHANTAFTHADLSVMEGLAETPVAGSVTGTAEISLREAVVSLQVTAASRDMGVAEWKPETVDLATTATGPLTAPEGTLSLIIDANGERLESKSAWSYADAVFTLEKSQVRIAENQADVHVRYDTADQGLEGRIEATLQRLSDVGRFAGVPMGGKGTLLAEVSTGSATSPRVSLNGVLESLQTPWLSALRVEAAGEMRGDWRAPTGEFQVALVDSQFGSLKLDETSVSARGEAGVISIEAIVKGQLTERAPVRVELAALVGDDAHTLTLGGLSGHLETYAFSLKQPVIVQRQGQAWELGAAELHLGEGMVKLQGVSSPDRVDAEVSWEGLPLALASVAGSRPLGGVTTGTLTVQGSPQAPVARITGKLEGVRFESGADSDVPPVNASFEGGIRDGYGTLEFSGETGDVLSAKGQGRIPVRWSLAPWSFELSSEESLDGSLDVAGDLTVLKMLPAFERDTIEGPVEGRFLASGTMGQPRLSGEVRVENARYENLGTGTILNNAQAVLTADGTSLKLAAFTADTVPAGKVAITGECTLDPEAGFPFSAGTVLNAARLANRDDLTAAVDGTVSLDGSTKGIRIGGDITLGPAVFNLPKRLPTRIATIHVEEKDGSGEAREAAPAPEMPVPIELDVRCRVPGRFFVRGSGLDSEWEGDLAVSGTAAEPALTGVLSVRRGDMLLLDRRFDLRESTISFDGSTPVAPYLDIWGAARTRDLAAQMHVYGTLQSVEIEFKSEPPLPEDQVLAQVLFDRDLSQLTPIQALQLARTASALGGGAMGFAALPTGPALPFVDRVRLETGEDPGETALGVGKYLGERTYVEVQQGLGVDSGKVSVQLELTPDIRVQSEVEADSQSAVGIFWKKDY